MPRANRHHGPLAPRIALRRELAPAGWRDRAVRMGIGVGVIALGIMTVAGWARTPRPVFHRYDETITDQIRRDADPESGGYWVLAAAPTITLTPIAGESGGPVPHQVCYRLDLANSSTGDGSRWEQGYATWECLVAGSTPTTRIWTTDPINGSRKYLDTDQHGHNANFLIFDEGAVTLGSTYTNSSGIISPRASASAGTTTARGSSAAFVNSATGSDSNNGLSSGAAKATLAAGITVLNSLGSGATLYLNGTFTVSATTNLTVANAWITKESGASTATLSITSDHSLVQCQGSADGLVISDIDATGTNGRYVVFQDGTTTYNCCIYRCSFGGIQDITSGSGQATIRGLSHICLTETASITSGQLHFSADCKGFLSFGVYSPLGSTGEHNYRFTSGNIVGRDNSFHSFHYYTGGCATTKSCLRWYGSSSLVVYGCDLRRAVYVGSHSPNDNSVGGTTILFERCHFQRYSGQVSDFACNLKSGWQQITFRSCFFDRINCLFQPRNNEGEVPGRDENQHDIEWINCDFYNTGGQSINWEHATTLNTPLRQRVQNCRFFGGNSSTNRYLWFKNTSVMTGYVLQGNLFERTNGQNIARNIAASTDLNFTQYQALTGVSSEEQTSSLTISLTTLEQTSGSNTGVSSAPYPFVSYFYERLFNQQGPVMTRGAWLDPAFARPRYSRVVGAAALLKV